MKYILIILTAYLTSCTSTKQVTSHRQERDSTEVTRLRDSLSVITTERNHFEAQVRELENQVVEFDSTQCPPIPEVPPCPGANMDSINQAIALYNAQARNLNKLYSGALNTIKVLQDGSIEATGRLRSYRAQREADLTVLASKDKEIDSLRTALAERSVRVVDKVDDRTVKKKTSFLPWWWFVLIGFAGATALFKGRQVISFLRG